ncbi:hypothetical protein GQ53DRAFT_301532 [Thozetella sp. PMI_491]|nr:hypothetical protein GQ53DRAFT_301532 [Thozetella sp. PMI_491]
MSLVEWGLHYHPPSPNRSYSIACFTYLGRYSKFFHTLHTEGALSVSFPLIHLQAHEDGRAILGRPAISFGRSCYSYAWPFSRGPNHQRNRDHRRRPLCSQLGFKIGSGEAKALNAGDASGWLGTGGRCQRGHHTGWVNSTCPSTKRLRG